MIDADTIRVDARMGIEGQLANGWPVWVPYEEETRVRLRHVQLPEIQSPKCDRERKLGLQAKAAVERLIRPGQQIALADIKADNYGRRIDSRIVVDGLDLGEHLLRAGYGHKWPDRRGWCGPRK